MPTPLGIYTPSVNLPAIQGRLRKARIEQILPNAGDLSAFRMSNLARHVWIHLREEAFSEVEPDIADLIRSHLPKSDIAEIIIEISGEPGSALLVVDLISIFDIDNLVFYDFDEKIIDNRGILGYLRSNFP